MRRWLGFAVAALVAAAPLGVGAQKEDDPHLRAVKALADRVLAVRGAQARYYGTASLDGDSHVTRMFVNLHGLLRNADVYEKTGEAMLAAAGDRSSAVVTPQFVTKVDVEGWKLPGSTLRWDVESWLDGSASEDGAHLSAFDVLDAIVARLADRHAFPSLREIVLMGHSAGGQLVQRYAVVGKAPAIDGGGPVKVRFVVANPSSYLYFDSTRPDLTDATTCPGFNAWKYGPDKPPPYVAAAVPSFEMRYLARDVTYLLGQRDVDPQHPVLDRSCMAEAQGAYRLVRGRNYVAYLRARHGKAATHHTVAEIPDVAHDANKMFTSPCGLAVLFDRDRAACTVISPL